MSSGGGVSYDPGETHMPPARRGRSPISLIFLAALAASCVPPAPPLTEAERETAVLLGGEAADRLAGTLIQHLTAAIDSAGPAGAIEFCAGRAMPITEDVNRQLGTLQVKRTSTRLRNPANAPDSLERVALAWFESELERTGAPPDAWVQEAGRTSVRYYRPWSRTTCACAVTVPSSPWRRRFAPGSGSAIRRTRPPGTSRATCGG